MRILCDQMINESYVLADLPFIAILSAVGLQKLPGLVGLDDERAR